MAKQQNPQFLKLVTDARARVRECRVEDFKKRLESGDRIVIMDVREESEYAAGHLPGAVHMGKGVIERDIETKVPDPATPLVIYCGGGYRSALAADAIQKMGYANVISMDVGCRDWTGKGYPVEK